MQNETIDMTTDPQIHPDTLAILHHFQFDRLPVEGTLYQNTYRSDLLAPDGSPAGTAMIGMYSEHPLSISCFHRLPYDEVWHVYGGDPFQLILLRPDGSSETVLMGSDPLHGQHVQFVIPAHTWQAGSLVPGGRYALFGCTMAPGFSGAGFEAGIAADLIAQYPARRADILRLSINGDQAHMPEGFER